MPASDYAPPTVSQAPAYLLGGLSLTAVALLLVVVWLGVQLRRSRSADLVSRVVQAVLFGLAVMCVALAVAGVRHYGGSPNSPDAQYNCGPWWQEAGLPSGLSALVGDLSPSCHHDAMAAIWPAIGEAAVAGAVAVLMFLLVVRLRQLLASRRAARPHDDTVYVDSLS